MTDTEDDGFEVLSAEQVRAATPQTAPKRQAMDEIDKLYGHIERLNTWLAELHKRVWALEDKAGIPRVSPEKVYGDDDWVEPT